MDGTVCYSITTLTTMELPARIGKYELEEFLGGGMSHVYRARDTVIGRTVAVKILTEQGCQNSEAKARFLAEARMAGNITHDNILSIYDFGEDEQQRPFMVMEFLRGQDLRKAIREGATGDLRSRLRIALQTARALRYIHTQRIIHRDVKPENIHVTPDGVVKLMDFGIAKTDGMAMTRVGFVLGTPYYMSPEQIRGQAVDQCVDVYAFGILLYELMTGSRPIAGDVVERIFYAILNEPINLEPLKMTDTPAVISDLINRCTAKNPGERPQDFAEVCNVIETALADRNAATSVLPVQGETLAMQGPPGRPAWQKMAMIGVPVLLAAVIGVVVLLPSGKTGGDVIQRGARDLPKILGTSTGRMVLVGAGDFLFGPQKQQLSTLAYYIDETEVSNAVYQQFCTETKRALPRNFDARHLDYPVVNVSFLDAREFAKWADKRLPTPQEWEKAARGPDGRIYPWGHDPDPNRVNMGTKSLQPVSSFSTGASPYGTLNMVGNAWEWVNDVKTPDAKAVKGFRENSDLRNVNAEEPWYSIRGLSFEQPNNLMDSGVVDSATVPARAKLPGLGFRCVKDPPQASPGR
jgi:hypothetical protein